MSVSIATDPYRAGSAQQSHVEYDYSSVIGKCQVSEKPTSKTNSLLPRSLVDMAIQPPRTPTTTHPTPLDRQTDDDDTANPLTSEDSKNSGFGGDIVDAYYLFVGLFVACFSTDSGLFRNVGCLVGFCLAAGGGWRRLSEGSRLTWSSLLF